MRALDKNQQRRLDMMSEFTFLAHQRVIIVFFFSSNVLLGSN
jgi:hypothetical protein